MRMWNLTRADDILVDISWTSRTELVYNYLSESLPKYTAFRGNLSLFFSGHWIRLWPADSFSSKWCVSIFVEKYLSIQKTLAMLFRMSKHFTSGLSPGKENFNWKEVISIDFVWQIQRKTRDCRYLPLLTMALRTIRLKMSWAMIKERLDKISQSVYIWKSCKTVLEEQENAQ